mmetsp:Transcript_5412/g.13112  ORF Transcript_5412/g.13112 Transcript_5412/m.13112 type:complete len:291 (-) Transcript_5412:55-927(-)
MLRSRVLFRDDDSSSSSDEGHQPMPFMDAPNMGHVGVPDAHVWGVPDARFGGGPPMSAASAGRMPPVASAVVPMSMGEATPPMPVATVTVGGPMPMASAVVGTGPPMASAVLGPSMASAVMRPSASYWPPPPVYSHTSFHQPHEEGSRPPSAQQQRPAAQSHHQHGVIHEPVIPVKVRLERIGVPRPDYKEFPHHDPAYGPWFRSNQPDRDEIDRKFVQVEPDVTQPLGWLWQKHKADELAERRQKQWEAKFQEMRHPKVKNLFQPDHGPATVCYRNKFEGHSLMSWLAA